MNRSSNPSARMQALTLWLAVEPTPELFEKRLLALGYGTQQIRDIFRHCDAIKRDLLAKVSNLSVREDDAEMAP